MQSNDPVIADWLSRRKITLEVQREFNIHEGRHPALGVAIIIPVHDVNGVFLFNKYRRHPLSERGPKYTYDVGSKVALYGAHKIKDVNKVLFSEGELDALVSWSHNIPAVSSTGGAMSINKEWAELLVGKEVIICFDNDSAGGEGMVRALEAVPWAKVLFLPDKPNVKDISDYVAHGGDLGELVKTAKKFGGIEDVIADRSERLATWQSVHFHDAYIKRHAERPRAKARDVVRGADDAIERAKSYPIPELLKFNHGWNTTCIFHKEKTGSLHYYEDSNTVYCFGMCGKRFDAIDVYRQLNGVGFKEAVKKLGGKEI